MPLLLYSNGNYEKKEGFGYEFQSEKNNYDSIIRCVSLCCYNVHREPADISILVMQS